MAHINYIKLYNYFTGEDNLSRSAALRNIWRVGNLPREFKSAILEITEERTYNVANFAVDGVELASLVEEEGMKPVQAVFFLDWLRREPANARAFMASRRLRTPMHEVTDDERELLQNALARTKGTTGNDTPSILVPEDNSGEDIDVETESTQLGVMTADLLTEHADVGSDEIQQMVDTSIEIIEELKFQKNKS